MSKPIEELEQAIYRSLETYSNVHRGSGYASQKSTKLYEEARKDILKYLKLSAQKYVVIFSSPRRARNLIGQLPSGSYEMLSSQKIGLNLGVCALAIKRQALPKGPPRETGGGTAKLTSKEWIIWAKDPDKFEAGTPAVINVLAFVQALQLIQKYGEGAFSLGHEESSSQQEWMELNGKTLLEKLRTSLIGSNLQAKSKSGERAYIHLDNAASTRTFNPIWKVFRDTLFSAESEQQQAVNLAKQRLLKFLGASSDQYDLIFTSNTTEAINIVADHLPKQQKDGSPFQVVNSLLEHSSNDLPWRPIPNGKLHRLGVTKEGYIDLKELETILKEQQDATTSKNKINLVSVSGASNVLGTCTPIDKISALTKKYRVPLMIDAAQMVAHRKIDVCEMGIDCLVLSGHKIYAPFGTGLLLVKKELLDFSAEEKQAFQQDAEHNAAGIAALGMAVHLLDKIGMDYIQEKEALLTKSILQGLAALPEYMVYGITDTSSASMKDRVAVVAFAHKKTMADKLAKKLTENAGIGLRAGCHCAHPIVKHVLGISPGLEKFQRVLQNVFPKVAFPGVARVSLGLENTEADVETILQELGK